MEAAPERLESRTEPRYAETFGIEPRAYEREVDPAIRDLAGDLHEYLEESSSEYDLPPEALEAVERLERAYEADDTAQERKSHLHALALEFLMKDMSHAWFQDCHVWRASSFDDYKRQTDLFLDIPVPPPGKGWVVVALDVTSDAKAASKKVGDAMAEYRRGWFHDVDYFRPPTDDDERPPGRTLMPRMVVGTSGRDVVGLAKAYGRFKHAGARNRAQEFDRLKFHPLAGQVFEELIRQAKVAHHMMRQNLLNEPDSNDTRREALKERSKYLDAVHRALKERYQRWKNMAREHEKQTRGFGMTETPLNPVLQAIVRAE